MKKALIGLASLLISGVLAAGKIILVGDSTMADYSGKYRTEQRPRFGWGEKLAQFCRDDVQVVDLAVPGLSTRSFMEQKHWEKALKQIQKGDYVIIQFGHNDGSHYAKNAHFCPPEQFVVNETRMVAEVRAKGGIPILLSTTVPYKMDKATGEKKISYGNAARQVAKKENVAFLDIREKMISKLAEMGEEKSRGLFMIFAPGEDPKFPKGLDDKIHLREAGAELVAEIFVAEARAAKLPICELFK